jgi:3-demethoxyubiquinol 3-hydroxylase
MELSARLSEVGPLGGRVLKVDHAGEHGAVNIYAAQMLLARFTAPSLVPELREFREHEQRHRSIFWAELQRRGIRRCRSYLLCGFGGFALGLITGLFGRGAIAATTVAVERVVLRHLQEQLAVLEPTDPSAAAAIRSSWLKNKSITTVLRCTPQRAVSGSRFLRPWWLSRPNLSFGPECGCEG